MPELHDPIKVFIGSSAEGSSIARNLQDELEMQTELKIEVDCWNSGPFTAGSITIDALAEVTERVDFAILIATSDDTVISRGQEMPAARDNIIFEFGLFLGALSRKRVYLLTEGEVKLPSDLLGLTRLTYRKRSDGNIRAGLNRATLEACRAIQLHGPRQPRTAGKLPNGTAVNGQTQNATFTATLPQENPSKNVTNVESTEDSPRHANNEPHLAMALSRELEMLTLSAKAQGWTVVKDNETMLRLRSPKSTDFTLLRKRSARTRVELRRFVRELRSHGFRVNHALRGPVEDSPIG